jgi:DNA-binding LacI/PurR family transcriptional regulator
MPATIRDVAKKAGVGLGTVSRVINDSPRVSTATRERVLEAIDALDYSPSPIARRLSLRKTLTIAAAIPFFTRPSAVTRLRGIANSLSNTEYDLIVLDVEAPERQEAHFSQLSRGLHVDGTLIISIAPNRETLEKISQTGTPIVLIDVNDESVSNFNRVVVDDVEGGEKATQHLIDLGHRRIGFISDPMDGSEYFTSSQHRHKGYLQAMGKAEIPIRPEFQRQGEHGRSEARKLARAMLELADRPTAIFATSDTQAMGVLEAARDVKIDVPEDLSVIGYDDIEVAEYLGLTTIKQMLYESGVKGVELLLEMLQYSASQPRCEVLPTKLVIRSTTGPPRGLQY